MAIATHVPPGVWLEEGEQTIVTAIDILRKVNEAGARGTGGSAHSAPGAGGPQYSG